MLQESNLIDTRSPLYKLRKIDCRKILKKHGHEKHNANEPVTQLRKYVDSLNVDIEQYLPKDRNKGQAHDPSKDEMMAQMQSQMDEMYQEIKRLREEKEMLRGAEEPVSEDGFEKLDMPSIRTKCHENNIKFSNTDKKADLVQKLRDAGVNG